MSDEKPPYGALVEYEGETSIVVGYEQGGRTCQLPLMPGGATREVFHKDLEILDEDPDPYQVYRLGLENAPIEQEVAEAVATLVIEGSVKTSALPMLYAMLGEDIAIEVANKLERNDE